MNELHITKVDVQVNIDKQELALDIDPTYVDLILIGPGIQGPPGPPGSGGGSTTLVALTDVDAVNRVDGSVLVYKTGPAKFVADDINTVTTLTDGGNF